MINSFKKWFEISQPGPATSVIFIQLNPSNCWYLTYKFISETLSEYFEEDDEAVMEIICYLKSKRQHKLVKEIKRYDVSG